MPTSETHGKVTGDDFDAPLGVFLHIPKTAGTSFNTLLTREYSRQLILQVPPGQFDDGARYFHTQPAETQRNVRLVRGHIYHGLHRSVSRRVQYFTVLRHPIDRIQSFLNHAASEAALRPEDTSVWLESVRHWKGIETYTRVQPSLIDNVMVRFISGDRFKPGRCTEANLHKAIANLDAMSSFGIFERLNESLAMMRKEMEWSIFPVVSRSKSGNPKRIILSAHERSFLSDRNIYDIQLYHHAKARFEDKLRQNPSIARWAVLSHHLAPFASRAEAIARRLRGVGA